MSHEKKRRPGEKWEPPRADEINSWNESAEYWELRKRLGEKLKDERMPVPTELDVIKVLNVSAWFPEGSVLQLGAEAIDQPTRLHPWLIAGRPTSGCARYCVLRYPTQEGEIRWAQVSGPTFALVDITAGSSRCGPRPGLTHFVANDDGPLEILWAPDGTGVQMCIVEMEQIVPPGTYVAKIPPGGIPARTGLYPGFAVCEIFKLDPHFYSGPESKKLVSLGITKTIYNLADHEIPEDLEYHEVHREECGNWMFSTASAKMLVLVSPKSDCFKSWIQSPQDMYLWKFQGGDWVITSEVVQAIDKTDSNFLLKGEPQWAQLRPGTQPGGINLYDLIGSRGLFRRAKTNGQIDCESLGSALVYDLGSGNPPVCGTADWYYDGTWTVIRNGCGDGCEPVQPEIVPAVIPHTVTDFPCAPSTGGDEDPADCLSTATECNVDNVCNSWGNQECILDGDEIHVRYLKNGIWTAIYLPRNRWYMAQLDADLCPGDPVSIDSATLRPLERCVAQDYLDNFPGIVNTFNWAGNDGEWVLILDALKQGSNCDTEPIIVDVVKKCEDIIARVCGDSPHVTVDGDNCKLQAYVLQKTSIATCKTPALVDQYTFPSQTIIESFSTTDTTTGPGGAQDPYATCKVDGVTRSICVVGKAASTGTTPVLTGELQEAITLSQLTDQGICNTYTELFVICVGGDDIDCLEITECPEGSGSA